MNLSQIPLEMILEHLERLSRPKFHIKDFCFDKQLSFIEDESLFKTAVCSRRAGKTIACAADLVSTALREPNRVGLYITLSRVNAKRIIWPELLKLNRDYNLNAKANQSDLSLEFPNKSVIYVSGAKDKSEVDNFRGLPIKKAYVDECFHPDTLVATRQGEVPISQIAIGDRVKNAVGYGTVTNVVRKSLSKHVSLLFNGMTVKCSLNHPFFTAKGWVNACDLQKGDQLVTHSFSMRILRETNSSDKVRQTSQTSFLRDQLKVSDRGGWKLPLQSKSTGFKERSEAEFIRLDDIEVHQYGSDERNPKGYFYDLSVSGHPSFTVGGVLVHNCQSFRPYIEELIDDVLSKALFDYSGTLCLIGTPGLVPSGYFHACATSEKTWSHHAWTMFENPFLEKTSGRTVQQLVQADCERMGVFIDHPKIQRECFGRWVTDPDSLVFKYDSEKNHFDDLPNVTKPWRYLVGVDVGFDDADAIAVIAWNECIPHGYLVEEKLERKQGITELANSLDLILKRYNPDRIVMDTGGLGKKIADEMRRRFTLPIVAAEKSRKFEYIELLNDALRCGRFFAQKNSAFAQDALLVEWEKDRLTPERLVISDSYHSDITDAVLYAFRESLHWMHVPEKARPKEHSDPWYQAEARQIEQDLIDQLKQKNETEIWEDFEWS